jgi:undecaprenyl-diphosphatase
VLGLLRGTLRAARRLLVAIGGGVARPGPDGTATQAATVARRRTGLASVAVAAGTLAFGALGWLVGSGVVAGADLALSTTVQAANHALLGAGLQAVSAVGSGPGGLVVLGAAPLALWRVGHPLASRFAALAAVGAIIASTLLKQLWLRPRPDEDLVAVIGDAPEGYSFPSGHTLLYVSFFGFLFYWTYTFVRPSRLRTALLWTCAALIGLIGLSRVYLGHHWASDVLASYALGLAWLFLLIRWYARVRLGRGATWTS